MTETWLGFCEKVPGPPSKQGYPGVASRTLAQIEGEVKHSMEGSYPAALGELMKLTRQASWHFSIRKSGPPVQHYPLEAITWHCGVMGDRRLDTSLVGNLTLVGMEHEDWPTNSLSDKELQDSINISNAIRELCPLVGAQPPTLRLNLWEHGWLSQTSCPSGLIPWAQVIEGLSDMTKEEFMAWFKEAMETTTYAELDNRTLLKHVQESDNWVLRSIGVALDKAAEDLKGK